MQNEALVITSGRVDVSSLDCHMLKPPSLKFRPKKIYVRYLIFLVKPNFLINLSVSVKIIKTQAFFALNIIFGQGS